MTYLRILGFLLLVLSAGSTQAEAKGRVRYGMAGCGVGALVFEDDNEKWKQIVASLVNGYFSGIQTFGITSGTSNCKTAGNGDSAALFITIHKERIAKDVVRGEGESLTTLASLMGCKSLEPVRGVLLGRVDALLMQGDTTGSQIRDELVAGLQNDQVAKANCNQI